MSVNRQEQAADLGATEVVPSSFMVYPGVLRADDFRAVPTTEWRRLLGLGKDASDPRNIFRDQKEAEGFRFAGQCTMQLGGRERKGGGR